MVVYHYFRKKRKNIRPCSRKKEKKQSPWTGDHIPRVTNDQPRARARVPTRGRNIRKSRIFTWEGRVSPKKGKMRSCLSVFELNAKFNPRGSKRVAGPSLRVAGPGTERIHTEPERGVFSLLRQLPSLGRRFESLANKKIHFHAQKLSLIHI